MSHVSCTKYTSVRKPETPVCLDARVAEPTAIRKRHDVEPQTKSSSYWGEMKAEEGKQTQPKVWVTSNHMDYPAREVAAAQPNFVKERSNFMRTASITLGYNKEPMKKVQMRLLDRAHYVEKMKCRRNEKQSKTKSELYVCPAEIEQWKKRHQKPMSHRQFSGRHHEFDRDVVQNRKAIQQDMLRSHFSVGVDKDLRDENTWVTQTKADFQPTNVDGTAGKVAMKRNNVSNICLQSPDLKWDQSNTSQLGDADNAPCITAAPGRVRPNRPATAVIREPVIPKWPKDTTEDAAAGNSSSKVRSVQHTKHSWELGYDNTNNDRYLTQQKIAFTGVVFQTAKKPGSSSEKSPFLERRNSLQRMVYNSSVPL